MSLGEQYNVEPTVESNAKSIGWLNNKVEKYREEFLEFKESIRQKPTEEKDVKMGEWVIINKDTKIDVLINDNIEIEHKLHDGSWIPYDYKSIEELLYTLKTHPNDNVCRYRLKPLEPIRITQDIFDILWNAKWGGVHGNPVEKMVEILERPVEIIRE